MAWTSVNSLNPPKKVSRLVVDASAGTAGGLLMHTGACVLYRVVLTCLTIDTSDGFTLVYIEDSLTDAGGTVLITVPFQAAGDTVELRFRNGLNFATGLGFDLGGGTTGNGAVMITQLYAQTKQA